MGNPQHLNIQFLYLVWKKLEVECNCRCINCKSQMLTSKEFIAEDGYEDSHHTCQNCGIHFNHLDGERFTKCIVCDFDYDKNLTLKKN